MNLMPLPYRLLAYVLLLGGLAGLSAWAGWTWRDRGARLAEARQEAMAQTRLNRALETERLEREALQSRLDAVAQEAARRTEQIRTVHQYIDREVIRYVNTPVRAAVSLPGDWRVLHDAAATGELPETPFAAGFFTSAARPVDDAAALATVARNYEQCALWREQLIGWQQWYETIAPSR